VELALALLVPGIAADNVDAALAAHDLAIVANLFDACSYLHDKPFRPLAKKQLKQGSIEVFQGESQGAFRKIQGVIR
jgi:hypothetical protein